MIGTVTLDVKHYKDGEGIEHIDIDQTTTGGIPGTAEKRTLSWKETAKKDPLFGDIIGKSRRTKIEVLQEEFLKRNWTRDTLEYGVVQSYVESDTPKSGTTWIANQVRSWCMIWLSLILLKTWGMEVVDEGRRYTRHVKFTGPGSEDIECRLVYDYRESCYIVPVVLSHSAVINSSLKVMGCDIAGILLDV